jgi:hypothetical protein
MEFPNRGGPQNSENSIVKIGTPNIANRRIMNMVWYYIVWWGRTPTKEVFDQAKRDGSQRRIGIWHQKLTIMRIWTHKAETNKKSGIISMELSGTAKHRHSCDLPGTRFTMMVTDTEPGILKPFSTETRNGLFKCSKYDIPTDVFQHENYNNCYNFTFIFTINSPALVQFGPCCRVIV